MSTMELKDHIGLLRLFMSNIAIAGRPVDKELAGIKHGFRSVEVNTEIYSITRHY